MIYDAHGREYIREESDNLNVDKGWSEDYLKILDSNYASGKITSPYEQSYVVNLGIRLIAQNIAQTPMKLYRGETLVELSNPANLLFEKPNENTSRFEMWEQTVSYLNLYGESFWYLNDAISRSIPAEIHVLNPRKMKHILKDNKTLTGWIYDNEMPMKPEEVIHFKLFSLGKFRGVSPIDVVRIELDSDYYASKYNKVFFENSALPATLIEAEKGMTEQEAKLLIKMWNSSHQGYNKAHKTGLLLGGKMNNVSMTQKDMEYLEGRREIRDRVLALLGVHKVIAGFTEGVNRATAETARMLFWQDTLRPMLIRIQEKLNAEFFVPLSPDLRCKWDLSAIDALQPSQKEQAELAESLQRMGTTRNELAEQFPHMFTPNADDGDVRYMPINMVPDSFEEDPIEPAKSTISEISKILDTKVVKTDTTKQDRYRTAFLRTQKQYEKLFFSKMKRYFYEQRKEVLTALNTQKASAIEIAEITAALTNMVDAQNNKLDKFVRPLYQETATAGAEMAYTNLGIERMADIEESVILRRVNKIKDINTTTYNQLKIQIREGLLAGESIPQVEKRVKEVYNFAAGRAKTIARTETAGIMTETSINAYKQEGVRKKRWLASPGARPEHAANAAQGAIPMDSNFQNGQPYPGTGTAEQVINCRCSISPVVE